MMHLIKLKKFFIYCLVGSLIMSALMAVVAVIAGEFNDITEKIFFTLSMVVAHSLVSLFFIWNDAKKGAFEKLTFFVNVLFILIVLSFVTSILGVWEVMSEELLAKLYLSYFVFGLASLYYDILSQALGKEKHLDYIVYVSQFFILILVVMSLPAIFIENAIDNMGEMYFRIMAAIGIIVGTLSILTAIFLKLYNHKHPEIKQQTDGQPKKRWSIWIWLLLIYLFFQAISLLFRYFL
jgi:hypothetical protein